MGRSPPGSCAGGQVTQQRPETLLGQMTRPGPPTSRRQDAPLAYLISDAPKLQNHITAIKIEASCVPRSCAEPNQAMPA